MTKKTEAESDAPATVPTAPPSVPLLSVAIPGMSSSGAASRAIPLFPDLNKDPSTTPAGVRVKRLLPEPAYMGQLSATADEEMIRAVYGGGVYELTAVNAGGLVIRGGIKTLKIDGEPSTHNKAAPAQQQSGGSMSEMMQWLDTRMRYEQETADRKVRAAQAELEAEQKRREQDVDLAIRKLEAQAQARINEERERTKLELDRERERHKMDQEREQKRIDAAAAAQEKMWTSMMQMQQSSNANMVTILTSTQNKSDPVETFSRGLELAAQIGREDPGVAITKSLTDGLGNLARMSHDDSRRGPLRQRNQGSAPAQGNAPAQGTHPLAKNPAPAARKAPAATESSTKNLSVVEKIKALFGQIHSQGQNPEKVLDALLEGDLVLAPAEDYEDEEEVETPPEQPKEKADEQPAADVARGRDRDGRGPTPTPVAGRGAGDGGPAPAS